MRRGSEIWERERTGKRSTPPPGSITWAINDDMILSEYYLRTNKMKSNNTVSTPRALLCCAFVVCFSPRGNDKKVKIDEMKAKKTAKLRRILLAFSTWNASDQ